MKRDYRTTARMHIFKDAIEQYRRTQEKIASDHPGLLDGIRDRLNVYDAATEEGCLKLDRKKNFDTIRMFTAMESGSVHFQGRLRKMLLEYQAGKNA
jgi:hypothetical protein